MTKYWWEKPAVSKAWLLNREAQGKCAWIVETDAEGFSRISQWINGVRVGYYV